MEKKRKREKDRWERKRTKGRKDGGENKNE